MGTDNKTKSSRREAASRREFFKLTGLGAGAAVVATAGSAEANPATTTGATAGAGYRETAHVKRYYQLAKY